MQKQCFLVTQLPNPVRSLSFHPAHVQQHLYCLSYLHRQIIKPWSQLRCEVGTEPDLARK